MDVVLPDFIDNVHKTLSQSLKDEKGNIKQMQDCSIADMDGDYIFNTDKELIRIQADN